jgi:hypothetical protein
LGDVWAAGTVFEAQSIAWLLNPFDPKPVQVLETGYPTDPTDGGCTGARKYSQDLQADYFRSAYAGTKSAGAEGFYAFILEDRDSDGNRVTDNGCSTVGNQCATGIPCPVTDTQHCWAEVETHFGLVDAAGRPKRAFDAYRSLIADNTTAGAAQGLSVQELAAVTGSLLDSEQERVVAATTDVLGTLEGPEFLTTTFQSDRVTFPMTLRIAWGQGGVVAQLLDPDGNFFHQVTGAASPLETSLRLPSAGEWQLRVWGVNMPAEGERVLAVVSTNRFAPTDLDRDGDIDLADFRRLMACFNGPDSVPAQPDCDDADVLLDGDVDLRDFALFQNVFLGCK